MLLQSNRTQQRVNRSAAGALLFVPTAKVMDTPARKKKRSSWTFNSWRVFVEWKEKGFTRIHLVSSSEFRLMFAELFNPPYSCPSLRTKRKEQELPFPVESRSLFRFFQSNSPPKRYAPNAANSIKPPSGSLQLEGNDDMSHAHRVDY